MTDKTNANNENKPLCPIFGECGGCQYQDISYEEELRLKESILHELFAQHLKKNPKKDFPFKNIVASPKQYHYRNRLDLRLLKTKDQNIFMGFSPVKGYRVVETDSCMIAEEAVSDFLPALKSQAKAKLPLKYRNANLVVRTGDDGRVFWGGIGRRSLKMKEEDYFWTQISGKKIFYSLDSFFQANLSILPLLIEKIKGLKVLDKKTSFFDLYGGVGFFGVVLFDCVKDVVLFEENIYATRLAAYNIRYHHLKNFTIIEGKIEDHLDRLSDGSSLRRVALIDPPRAGLSAKAAQYLAQKKIFNALFYLSCHPKSLVRDLAVFINNGWAIKTIIPFDFFPRTKHMETLALLTPDT